MSTPKYSKLSAKAFADDVINKGVEKSYTAFDIKIDKKMWSESNIQLTKTESEISIRRLK